MFVAKNRNDTTQNSLGKLEYLYVKIRVEYSLPNKKYL